MKKLSPRSVVRGDMVGILAPATLVDPHLLHEGAERIGSWGYPVCFDDRILAQERFLAGPDETRARNLHDFVMNPMIRALWCARGGYGVPRILPLLDHLRTAQAMRRDPKPLLGYSDITALHLYFWGRCGLKSVHAPLTATAKFLNPGGGAVRVLRETLDGTAKLGAKCHTAKWPLRPIKPLGRAVEGTLLGGNLTLIASLAGTPWQPSFRGSILFLEDCAEPAYRLDRMITQLWNSGMLDGLRAVVCGDFEADLVVKTPAEKKWWRAVMEDRFLRRGVPVITGAPVGHGARNEPLPLGVRARVTKAGRLEILEQVVS
ncbi:MAG: LD-carboxypeptidase [Bdellovibrionales bacterium]|nr:LD-carboxypeptidase [Bdellovibrionales bacterium]